MKPLFNIVIIGLLLVAGCMEKPTDNNSIPEAYVSLKYFDFMKVTSDSIAATMASILNIGQVSLTDTASRSFLRYGSGELAVHKGYKYLGQDSEQIVVWTDSLEHPYAITYFNSNLDRDTLYPKESLLLEIRRIMERIGINLDGTESASLVNCGTISITSPHTYPHWWEYRMSQTFNGDSLLYPYFMAEALGDTTLNDTSGMVFSKIYFLRISRWYTNLDNIHSILTDDEIAESAKAYYIENGYTTTDSMTTYGLHIVEEKLCKKVGTAVIDSSSMYLFIDIQNGKVISEEFSFVD